MDSKSIVNNTTTSDIYCDLSTVDLGEKIIQLQELLKLKELRIEKYEDDVRKLCFELTRMKKTECNLKTNISELYKASKLEIERKDRQIAELQRTITEFVIKTRSGKIGNSFKCFRDEAYAEDLPELPQTKNESSIQQYQKTKSRSKSPKHRSPTAQQTELMVKDTSKIHHINNTRSSSPRYRSRSRHNLQSGIEYKSLIENRRSNSRSKSDSTQKPRPSPDGGSKVRYSSCKRRQSRSRPNSPKRTIERSRSTLPEDTFKMQNKTSKSRSKSPTYNSCRTQKSRSVEQNSVIHHNSRSRSPSWSQKSSEMHQPIKSRAKSPRHVDYSKRTILKTKDKSAIRPKGTKNCSKTLNYRNDRRQRLQIRIKADSTVRQVRTRKTRSPVHINRNSRCYRSYEKDVPNTENDVSLGYRSRKIYEREVDVINNSSISQIKSKAHESESKQNMNEEPLKKNSKRIEEKIKASDSAYLLVRAVPHEKQSASDLCDKEIGKENCNTNSEKVENSNKPLISNNKTAFVNQTGSEIINSSFLDNQKRPTTDILTSDSSPKNMLPNTPTAGDDVNSEMKKTDITVRRRRRCVIQLI